MDPSTLAALFVLKRRAQWSGQRPTRRRFVILSDDGPPQFSQWRRQRGFVILSTNR